MSKYDDNEYFGKCQYCKSGRLKWVQNVDLKKILNDANIIHKNNWGIDMYLTDEKFRDNLETHEELTISGSNF